MNSLIKQTSRLVVLTLITGLLVMPTYPVWAEDLVEVPTLESIPTVAETLSVDLLVEPALVDQVVTTDPPVVETIAEPTPVVAEAPVTETVVIVDNTPVSVAGGPVVDGELDFTTTSNSITPIDNLAISEEFGTDDFASTDNLAISDELSLETTGTPLIDKAEISWELNFVTLPVSVDNLAISGENSFSLPNETTDTLATSGEFYFSTQPVLADTVVVSGEMSFTTLVVPIDTLMVSGESSFNTLSVIVDTLTISGEMSFITDLIPTDDFVISGEYSFVTKEDGHIDQPTISDELSFDTLPVPGDNLAISGELSFTTLATPVDTLTVSDELSFITLPVTVDTLAVGDELSFTTLSVSTDSLSVSEEQSFTTESSTNPPVNPPGGGGGGCSGSGCGGSTITKPPYACPIFLKKFIKYGEVNDRFEVIKLQVFLRIFEGFKNLKVTGIYDRATYEAVKVFQERYARDVLKPWGITDSTGYVYITTSLAINNIFCGRDTKTNLRFYQEFNEEYRRIIGEEPTVYPDDNGYYLIPTTTATTSPITVANFLLAGIGSLLDFISVNFCWLVNLLLLLLILFLLWLLWLAGRDDDEDEEKDEKEKINSIDGDYTEDPVIGAIPLEDILTTEDEEALGAIIGEEEEQLPAANNNPEQETILLGPETVSGLDKTDKTY